MLQIKNHNSFIQVVFKKWSNRNRYTLRLKKLYMELISIWNNNNKQKIVTYLKLTRCQFGDQMFSCLMLYIQSDPDGLALIPRQLLCTHFATIKMLEKQSHNNCFSLWIIHINHSVERSHHHSKQKYEWIFLFDHFFNLRVFFPSFLLSIYVVLLPLPCFVLLNI